MIWSDPSIQQIATNYVCVIEETFFLYPPDWLKNPPNPAATRLFKTYARNAPRGVLPQNSSTYQGLYAMLADGTYLSGKFARQSNVVARDALEQGLANFKKIAAERGYRPKPVPTDKLELYGGGPLRKGGIKLEVAYRDFPRGDQVRPGDWYFKNPYNLGWYDLTPAEAKHFVTDSKQPESLPDAVFQKLACKVLKDAVRGQMRDWKPGDIKQGALFTQLVGQKGSVKTFALKGKVDFAHGDVTYAPKLYGTASYDTGRGEFTDFRLVAAGQRTGKAGANGRTNDLGPAPMGVGLKLYQ